jgi:hypothetical protein
MKAWHARANARRSALRAARRTLLSPDSSPTEKHRALDELLLHTQGPNAWRGLEACKAILDSDYLRDWLPPGRSPAQLQADERRSRRGPVPNLRPPP